MGLTLFAQNEAKFNGEEEYLKVYKNQVIVIEADSAYIINTRTAEFLNRKLNELDTIRTLFRDISLEKESLFNQIDKLEKTIIKVKNRFSEDSVYIRSELETVIKDLETLSKELEDNNNSLNINNIKLKNNIKELEALNREMKKELRHIWWSGMTDKIVVFIGGIVIGAAIVIPILL